MDNKKPCRVIKETRTVANLDNPTLEPSFSVDAIAKAEQLQHQVASMEEELETADKLIEALTKALNDANTVMEVFKTKIKEHEVTIMKLNNGIMKACRINNVKQGINGR